MITLYHLQSSQSFTVVFALIHCEVEYELVNIPRRLDRDYKELREVNSLGRAPALRIDDKTYLETRLCVQKVQQIAQNAMQRSEEDAERDDYFAEFSTATFYADVRLCLAMDLIGEKSPFLLRPMMKGIMSAIVGRLRTELNPKMDLLESSLTPTKPFLGGTKLGVSDFMLIFPMDMAVQRGYIDLKKWPNVHTWYESIQGMDSYREAVRLSPYDLRNF